ncbi:hypothetical protein GCM10027521_15550 [Amycolatopsis cihanbeyliensis]
MGPSVGRASHCCLRGPPDKAYLTSGRLLGGHESGTSAKRIKETRTTPVRWENAVMYPTTQALGVSREATEMSRSTASPPEAS